MPRRSSLYVTLTVRGTPTITSKGRKGTLYEGVDDRGIELEVITVMERGEPTMIHAMPTADRHKRS